MADDKYIGLALAMASSLGIGSSSIIQKKGLMHVEKEYGFQGEGFAYLKSPLWWLGTTTLMLGEFCNFAAYAFAPAILVTPLGALSVLVAAVLGSYVLGERLGRIGKLGSALCFIGAVVIILHAPPDKDITTVDEIMHYALRPGFVIYAIVVSASSFALIYKLAPLYGKKNPLVYVSICSLVGSVSIMAIKAFGIAVKLTLGGSNQFVHPSTYIFMAITAFCILVQLNYLNKALSHFPTNIVNPLYFVTFTTGTICASLIFYGGFNTNDVTSILSLVCGFLVTFMGVHLLNISRRDPDGITLAGKSHTGRPLGAGELSHSFVNDSSSNLGSVRGDDREGLMRSYNESSATLELDNLAPKHAKKSDRQEV